jgi:hypothetical protein
MDLGRLGYVLILLMMALPMAILTLRILVIAGFTAVIGFAAMFLLGVVALVGRPIPGWFRRFGTKGWEYTLGLQLQALFVTTPAVVTGSSGGVCYPLLPRPAWTLCGALPLRPIASAMKSAGRCDT